MTGQPPSPPDRPSAGRRRRLVLLGVLALTLAAGTAVALPRVVAEVAPLVLAATADTTVTRVPQDGDNGVKTTLASCPRRCEGNPDGQRDAVLEFNVRGLPRDAVDVRVVLRVYAWQPFASRVRAYRAQGSAANAGAWAQRPVLGPGLATRERVDQGFNEWDVSAAVTGNGRVTLALTQEDWPRRIYWASRENARAALRPGLVVTYRREPGTTARTTAAARPPRVGPVVPPAPPPADRPGARVPGWRLVWSDEFDGPTLDRSKWNVRDGEPRDVDLGCNVDDPENVIVTGGVLTLRAQRRSMVCAGQPRQYTEGYLDTIGKASFRYGRFEIRAESPNGPTDSQGLWPAFWLRPDDGGRGEIDVVELPGGAAYHRAVTQAIFYDYSPVKQDQRWEFPAGYPGDGFHTYTTEWEPGVLRWYVDGRLVWQRDRRTTPWFDEVFHKPYNLRLNFQVGGWLGPPDAATGWPADFRVDHVRVWQR